jgi:hypothetical protein
MRSERQKRELLFIVAGVAVLEDKARAWAYFSMRRLLLAAGALFKRTSIS